MTLNWIKNIILFVFLNLLALSPSLASDRIRGSDIKAQAAIYFTNHGLNLKLALSDKRTFFPAQPLYPLIPGIRMTGAQFL